MDKKIVSLISIVALLFVALLFYYLPRHDAAPKNSNNTHFADNTNRDVTVSDQSTSTSQTESATLPQKIYEPISYALSRVNKKPFAIDVSPQRSPVSPERFSGYHAGVDFEAQISEQDSDVSVYAICSGVLAEKKYASGYGGVAVQRCKINNEDVTVIYGHLRLSSITPKIGALITGNDKIGVLGKGYSSETDGERKHLHLGIHRGTSINLLGYVPNQSQLKDWIDVTTLLR